MSSTTLQTNCFWSIHVPLVNLKMWSDPLQKCGSIFPEFRKLLKRKKKKEKRKLPVIQRSMRRTEWGSFRQNGKLAGHVYSMITMGWGVNFWVREKTNLGAFWGLLAQMVSALKIKCPTLITLFTDKSMVIPWNWDSLWYSSIDDSGLWSNIHSFFGHLWIGYNTYIYFLHWSYMYM